MSVSLVAGFLVLSVQWTWVLTLVGFYFVYHLVMGVVRGRGGMGPR